MNCRYRAHIPHMLSVLMRPDVDPADTSNTPQTRYRSHTIRRDTTTPIRQKRAGEREGDAGVRETRRELTYRNTLSLSDLIGGSTDGTGNTGTRITGSGGAACSNTRVLICTF